MAFLLILTAARIDFERPSTLRKSEFTDSALVSNSFARRHATGALYTGIAYWAPFVVGSVLLVPILGLLNRVRGSESVGTTAD